jgi:DNA-binding transcriptional ArsR family regulator
MLSMKTSAHSLPVMGFTPSPEAMAQLRASAGRACALLKAMANEDRLLLLCQLAEGERNVGELHAHTGIVQPTLSQQLGVLRDEGLVDTRREGKYIYYQLASADVMAVMQALYASFCGTVARAPSATKKEHVS